MFSETGSYGGSGQLGEGRETGRLRLRSIEDEGVDGGEEGGEDVDVTDWLGDGTKGGRGELMGSSGSKAIFRNSFTHQLL